MITLKKDSTLTLLESTDLPIGSLKGKDKIFYIEKTRRGKTWTVRAH